MHGLVQLFLDILIVAAFWWAAPRNGEHVRAVLSSAERAEIEPIRPATR